MRSCCFSRKFFRSVLLFLWIFLFLINSAFCQHIIRGHVTGKDGVVLAGATVSIKGTKNISSTDIDGNFAVMGMPGNLLEVSFVGYEDYRLVLGNETELNILLSIATMNLGDVVVIGYGTSKKKDLTGAVGSVSEKDFNQGIFDSPDQLIKGKVAGVQIMNNNGQPGGSANIKIRGNAALTGTGQPLYVIDGVPIDGRSLQAGNNPLNFINPDDIASIDILKDASATAIYGSRASYGVILINTKKGQSGRTKLELGISVGVSSILKKIKMLNASQFRDALKYYNVSDLYDNHADVDALDAVSQKGLQQNYTITISGGTETGKYRLSGGFLNQDGIIRKTSFKKYTSNLSTNFKFLETKKLGLDFNINSSQYIQDVPAPAFGSNGLITSALQWNPTVPLRKAEGSLNIFAGDNVNPIALTEMLNDNLKVTTVFASFAPYYRFNDWLEIKFLGSINYSSGISRSSLNQALLAPNAPWGMASISSNELITQQFNPTVHFNKEIYHGLKLDAVGGFEYMKFTMKGFAMNGYGVTGIGFGNYGLDYTNYIQFTDPSRRSISSFADPLTELRSFFARTIFNYQDKYLLTATFRADGSTKFGENNKNGYFPAFAAAWNISNQKFFKIRFINSLKLRAGWGKTGNQEFPSGSSQIKYSFRDGGSIIQVNSPNPDLKWQSDKQYNIGINFSILNNRILGTVDYFNKTTTNLLFPSVPIQPAPPLSVVRWVNLHGEIKNKGLEFLFNGAVISNKKLSWDVSVNGTFLKNSVSNMPSPIFTGFIWGPGTSGTLIEVIQNGLPMNAFYTRKFLGMDKSTGFSTYQDDGNTFYYVGNPNPKALVGFSSTTRYKKFSVAVNVYGAFGQDIFYNTLLNLINTGGINAGRNIALSEYRNPVKEAAANPITPSSRFIFKGNYLKMSNLTISYDVGYLSKGFNSAKIFITGQNLFIITKYPGFDPEANYDGSNNGVPSIGIDFAQYPSARTIIFGINVSL